MKTIVLYRSISGYTKKYAQWIAEELGADIYDCRKVKQEILSAYDLIIFGGSLRMGGINGINTIKRNLAALSGKRVIIFAIGGSIAREEILEEILSANFSDEQRKQFRLFYLRGGFDFNKLDIMGRILMIRAKWRLQMKRSADLTPDEKDHLDAYAHPADGTKRESIRPLIEYARS